MNKLFLIILIATLLSGCTERTQYGSCIGIADDRDPKLVYKIDILNTVLSVIFVETIFVPVIVLSNETFCPVSTKW